MNYFRYSVIKTFFEIYQNMMCYIFIIVFVKYDFSILYWSFSRNFPCVQPDLYLDLNSRELDLDLDLYLKDLDLDWPCWTWLHLYSMCRIRGPRHGLEPVMALALAWPWTAVALALAWPWTAMALALAWPWTKLPGLGLGLGLEGSGLGLAWPWPYGLRPY